MDKTIKTRNVVKGIQAIDKRQTGLLEFSYSFY
jgi:hypothetical protein